MSLKASITLPEYAGQRSDVVVSVRQDGRIYFTFESQQGFGHASVEERQLYKLLDIGTSLREISG